MHKRIFTPGHRCVYAFLTCINLQANFRRKMEKTLRVSRNPGRKAKGTPCGSGNASICKRMHCFPHAFCAETFCFASRTGLNANTCVTSYLPLPLSGGLFSLYRVGKNTAFWTRLQRSWHPQGGFWTRPQRSPPPTRFAGQKI